MGNCLRPSYDEANRSIIDRSCSSSSFSFSSGPSGPITAASALSESTTSYTSGGNSIFSLATSASPEERDPGGETSRGTTPTLRMFSYSELEAASDGFKTENELGEGGFGKVYKGWIDVKPLVQSKTVVAIKKLNSNSFQGFEQWQSEVNLFGSLSHPNFVKLLGYCWEDQELLLVYEYMQKGSLDSHLFKRSVEPLSWDRRIKIALGVAQGLAYLHTDRQIIYRDFKASNVLLDRKYNAKLSDFGLAKFGPSGEQTHLITRIMGTHGYAAPEYVNSGRLYVKSDVYGFGVVLLEILTGRRVISLNRPDEQRNLIEYTKNILPSKRKLPTIIDRRMAGQYPFEAVVETAQLTQKCLRKNPKTRPSMTEVVETLQQIKAMNDHRSQHAKKSSSSSYKG